MATISDDNVVISVEVDSKDAEGKLKVLGKTINDVGENSEQSFSKSQASLVSLAAGVQIATTAFNVLSGILSSVSDLLPEAGKVDALSRSFTTLQESVGNNATVALEQFRATTQGLVSDLDLFQVANKAVLLNLPTEGFQEAAASAIQLGRAMGIDAKQAIDDFTTGVGRGSIMILDNLGIIVNAEKAYKDFAEANKIVGRELSETEKKTAFATEAYRAITEAAKNTAQVTLNTADAYQVVQVSLQNLGTEALQTLANNNELRDAFIRLNGILQDIDVTQLVNGLATIASYAVDTIGIIAELTSSLIRLFSVDNVRLDQTIRKLGSNARSSFGIADEATQKFLKGINEVGKIGKLTGEQFDFVSKKIKEYRETVNNSNISDKEKIKIIDELVSVQAELRTRTLDLGDSAEKSRQKLDSMGNTLSNIVTPSTSKATEATKELNTELAEEARLQREVTDGFLKLEEAKTQAEKDEDKRFEQINQALVDGFTNSLSSALGDALTTAFEGGNSEDYKDIGRSLGGSIGSGLASGINPLLAPIGQAIGDKLGAEIFDGLNTFAKGNSSEIRKEIAGTFGDILLFGATGFVGGGNLLAGLLGGKDAEANARQALTNTLNDAIKSARKDFGINLSSFYLERGRDAFNPFVNEAGEITTAVGEQFQMLSGDIQQTFANLAPALQSVFGLDELGLGQITEMFAVNFGGITNNLNDLQLLFQSMGITAEQVEEQITNAFLNGDLAAEDFIATLNQSRDLLAQGIPGAVGATDVAFQNLADGGLESGRIAMDAFGDIAVEAVEKGITSFSELRADLIRSGKSVAEVDKFLQALSDNGIDSLEELQNISAEETAGVIQSLNNMAFGFAEVTDDIKNLADEIEKIKSKKVDIEFNVKTNYDSNTQQLLNNTVTSQYIPQVGNA